MDGQWVCFRERPYWVSRIVAMLLAALVFAFAAAASGAGTAWYDDGSSTESGSVSLATVFATPET
ncbi:MAG: hypothetical protein OEV43_07950 [Coriobacteriia bacterium]|nr:hypothetical protein [Coriobacteriia bacterium]